MISTMTTPAHHATTLHSLFVFKAWSDDELFAKLATLDAEAHPAEAHNALRILNHIHVVDCIFKAHLTGRAHGYQATNTPETPALAALAAAVKATDAWFIEHVARLSASALQERLQFSFTDGDAGLMSREEILLHLITHGAYHRGAVGQVMRSAGVAPPRDLYTRFLHQTEPARRA